MPEDISKEDLVFGLTTWEAVQYELKRAPDGWDLVPEGEEVYSEIIGGCYVTNFGEWCEIAAFSINPKYRRLGIGNYLLKEVLKEWQASHVVCLMVETEDIPSAPMDCTALTAWYQRRGFVIGSPFHSGEGWMSYDRRDASKMSQN